MKRISSIVTLALVLALCLAVSGCYFTRDYIG